MVDSGEDDRRGKRGAAKKRAGGAGGERKRKKKQQGVRAEDFIMFQAEENEDELDEDEEVANDQFENDLIGREITDEDAMRPTAREIEGRRRRDELQFLLSYPPLPSPSPLRPTSLPPPFSAPLSSHTLPIPTHFLGFTLPRFLHLSCCLLDSISNPHIIPFLAGALLKI